MPVIFDEKEHRYTNSVTGENYISVTTLLSKFKPKFDIDAQAARYAQREGLLVEDVKQYWKDLNRISTDRGTAIHAALESYLKENKYDASQRELLDYIKKQLRQHSEYNLISEEKMWNDEFKIAGTADIVLEETNFFKIWDLKTNKKFRFTNNFKSDTFLLEPVEHLTNCEYSNYCLQLSLYAFMKEQLTGKKCIELKIVYLKTDPLTNMSIVEEYFLPYLKTDILKILKNKQQNNF